MPVTRPTQVALDCSRRDLLSPWERSKSREFGSLPQPALCPTHEGRLNRSSPYPSSRTRFESCWTGSKSPRTLGMSLFDSHSGVRLRSGDNRPADRHHKGSRENSKRGLRPARGRHLSDSTRLPPCPQDLREPRCLKDGFELLRPRGLWNLRSPFPARFRFSEPEERGEVLGLDSMRRGVALEERVIANEMDEKTWAMEFSRGSTVADSPIE